MSRLFVLGLDGATFDLIRPWAERGDLPALAAAMRGGAVAPLRSVPNMNTAPAWTTFMTGVNPGKHGIFWFAERNGADASTVRFVTAADRRAPSVWRRLSDAGRRVIAVNVPLTYPAEPVNGVLLAGFDAPSTRSAGFSHPAGLLDDLEREVGRYVLHATIAPGDGVADRARVVQEILEAEESRVRAALHLMRTREWDVAMYMVKATDQAAHHVWDHRDPDQSAMLPVYRYADRALARFLEAAGEDVDVLVMSDHGMGWRQPAAEHVNEILRQLGFLARRERARSGVRWRAFRAARLLGPRTKAFLKHRLPGAYRTFGYQIRFGGIDWTRTRAYGDDTRSCVWVNLAGREPDGIVTADERARVLADVREVLEHLVDADTGKPIVEAVRSPEDSYVGPYVDAAPDLQIEWRYETPVAAVRYEGRLGRAESRRSAKGFMHGLTGAHRMDGVLVATGPSFRAGAVVEDAGLEDLAPTILHLLDVDVPDVLDGRVLREALSEPLASRPTRSGGDDVGGEVVPIGYSDAEAAEMEARLAALGYL